MESIDVVASQWAAAVYAEVVDATGMAGVWVWVGSNTTFARSERAAVVRVPAHSSLSFACRCMCRAAPLYRGASAAAQDTTGPGGPRDKSDGGGGVAARD